MSFLFGGAPQVKKDPVKDYQKDLRHATRSMDREEIKAGVQEKSLTSSIVKLAKEGRVDLCKAKAKELVRLRAHRHRIATMKGHMSTLQHQLSTVQSAKVMQETMAKTTHLLRSLNARLDAKAIHRMLMEFERQSVTFTDGQEILESTLDGIFESEEEQTNTDQAVASVFNELGLELQFEMASSSGNAPQILAPTDENIEARLRKLQSL
jgi:division protein CdvB (Snf7/Vps24/ESCRT-III family)